MLNGVPECRNGVAIALPLGAVVISCQARELLIDHVRPMARAARIVEELENAGASRPVELEQNERGMLHGILDEWARSAGGSQHLPEGIRSLRRSLASE
jgi:hypothetical protein